MEIAIGRASECACPRQLRSDFAIAQAYPQYIIRRKNSVRLPVMRSLRICRLGLSLALLCTLVSAQNTQPFTSPLPTGVRLDPAGDVIDLGSLPINLVLAPEADKAVVVLSGWREQGVQVVDLKTRRLRKHCSRMARS